MMKRARAGEGGGSRECGILSTIHEGKLIWKCEWQIIPNEP
jgi:hypothetical protein